MDKILVARNCHKAVINGATVCNADISWIMPDIKNETSNNFGIYGAINPKDLENQLKLNDYKAFILTSPTYEGINSDIEAISKICKQYNTYLIVDEAHGSLYNFSSSFPKLQFNKGQIFRLIHFIKMQALLINAPCCTFQKMLKILILILFKKRLIYSTQQAQATPL